MILDDALKLCEERIIRRFWAKVEKTPTCWVWVGAHDLEGYGVFVPATPMNSKKAHRFSYELTKGPIPEYFTIDHLCRNRECVNPEHLEAVSTRTNVLRGVGVASQNARKTHCPKGHPYDLLNTYRNPTGGRACRICLKIKAHTPYMRRYKTAYCRHGHKYTPENTRLYIENGKVRRRCRMCVRVSYRQRKDVSVTTV